MNSIFVMCPRGNVQLECFRIFEALLCGAIPVIAGCSKSEIQKSFSHLNLEKKKNCWEGWVLGETWEETIQKCQSLLQSENHLQQMQDQNVFWWKSFMILSQKKDSSKFVFINIKQSHFLLLSLSENQEFGNLDSVSSKTQFAAILPEVQANSIRVTSRASLEFAFANT